MSIHDLKSEKGSRKCQNSGREMDAPDTCDGWPFLLQVFNLTLERPPIPMSLQFMKLVLQSVLF